MGIRRTGNGGNWPPEGERSPDEQPELPGLPPEWGKITIPDDPSELAAEAEQVRQELARRRGARPWRQRLIGPGPSETEPAIGVPLLIMSVAVLITLISLFAMAWSGSAVTEQAPPEPRPMPQVALTDTAGGTVNLPTLGPAAVLLVEQCDCAQLVADTVAAAPAGVTVVTVDVAAPPAGYGDALVLVDPDGALREALGLSPPTGAAATVVLVNRDQEIIYTSRAASVSTFRSTLATLT